MISVLRGKTCGRTLYSLRRRQTAQLRTKSCNSSKPTIEFSARQYHIYATVGSSLPDISRRKEINPQSYITKHGISKVERKSPRVCSISPCRIDAGPAAGLHAGHASIENVEITEIAAQSIERAQNVENVAKSTVSRERRHMHVRTKRSVHMCEGCLFFMLGLS